MLIAACVHRNFLLFCLEPLEPGRDQNAVQIHKDFNNALAEAIATKAQQNCGKTSSEQFENNVEIISQFLTTTGASAVKDYFNIIKIAIIDGLKGAKSGNGNLVDTLTGTLRGATGGIAEQIPIVIGESADNLVKQGSNKCTDCKKCK